MILTGRPVAADEAQRIGLADRIVPDGEALSAAVALAKQIAAFPQRCMASHRMSAYRQWYFELAAALAQEAHAGAAPQIGRAHVWTPATTAHLECRPQRDKKKTTKNTQRDRKSTVH